MADKHCQLPIVNYQFYDRRELPNQDKLNT